MTDRTKEIQALEELEAKQEKAKTLVTQILTRQESLEATRADILAKMEAMNVSPDNAEEKLAKLVEKFDTLLAQEQQKLRGIDL